MKFFVKLEIELDTLGGLTLYWNEYLRNSLNELARDEGWKRYKMRIRHIPDDNSVMPLAEWTMITQKAEA